MNPPKVFGVEMRAKRNGFELDGCVVQPAATRKGKWVAEIYLDCIKMHFAICDTPEAAAESIERAIDDIRADVARLGT